MIGLLASTRARLLFGAALLVGLVATFPLALAFRMAGLDAMGLAARSLRGPVWWGGAEELTVAGVRIGTVDMFLDPLRLLIGTVRLDAARVLGRPDDLAGGISLGMGSHGLEKVTGSFAIGHLVEPLPISRAELDGFTVRFVAGRCAFAQGRVRVHVPALVAGLSLANGLTGEARCDGEALLLPLVSQSGQARLELRVSGDGGYEAQMRVSGATPTMASALAASGFRPAGGEQRLRVTGRL
jgi:general secretion pathway protein N